MLTRPLTPNKMLKVSPKYPPELEFCDNFDVKCCGLPPLSAVGYLVVSGQLEAPLSAPLWCSSSFNSVGSCQVKMQRWAASVFFFSRASTGSGSWGLRLSFVSSQCQTVHPHRGHAKKSRGITRVCFPPRPSLLSLLLHLLLLFLPLSSYIPGALFFAGKHSPATGGEVELFGGINGNSASGRLPECSCLLCGPFRFTALLSVPGLVEFLFKQKFTKTFNP